MKKLFLTLLTLTSVSALAAKGYGPKKRAAVVVAPAAPVKPAAPVAPVVVNPFEDLLKGFDGVASGSTADKMQKLADVVTKVDTKMNTFSAADIKLMPSAQKNSIALSLTELSKRINAMLKEYLEYSYCLTYMNWTRSFVNSDPVVADLLRYSDIVNHHYTKINPGNFIKKSYRFAMNHKGKMLIAYAMLNAGVKLNRYGKLDKTGSSAYGLMKTLAGIVLP